MVGTEMNGKDYGDEVMLEKEAAGEGSALLPRYEGFYLNSTLYRRVMAILQWTQLLLVWGFTLYAYINVIGMGRYKQIYPDDPVGQIGVIIHIVPSGVWFMLSGLQFLDPLRRRFPRFHRWAGRVSNLLGLALTAGAFAVAFSPRPEGGVAAPMYVIIAGPLYLLFLYKGFVAIRRGQVQKHALYMTRAQMITFAIIFMRPVAAVIAITKQWDPVESRDMFAFALGAAFFFTAILFSGGYELIYAALHARDGEKSRAGRVANAENPMMSFDYSRSFVDCKRVETVPFTDNVSLIRLALPDGASKLHMPIGAHCELRAAAAKGRMVRRPYTPVELESTPPGCVDFVVKRVPDGKMSNLLHDGPDGMTVQLVGPVATPFHVGRNAWRSLTLIAAGTGVLPLYNIAKGIAGDPGDVTDVRVITLNRGPTEVLLEAQFEELSMNRTAGKRPFSLHFLYGDSNKSWPDLVDAKSEAGKDAGIVVCGPPGMMYSALRVLTRQKKYRRSQVFAMGIDDR